MGIKNRILEYAETVERHVPIFASKIFGSENFFTSDQQVTIHHLIALAANYPYLNLNWVFTGNGGMIYIEGRHYPAHEYGEKRNDTDPFLIKYLEDELEDKQKQIDDLKLQLKSRSNN